MTHCQPRVWAPRADNVELVTSDDRAPMRQGRDGWWFGDRSLAPGDRYGFALDGGDPRPDPRSRFQPDGVHALSQIVDRDAYQWRHPGFRAGPLSSAVLYEMHVGTFTDTGTLAAAIDRLDHLVDLGITHVAVMPLNAFDGAHGWGYDGVCWLAPHAPYCAGEGPDAVKRFVDECHARGLAVILDAVYNHLGPSGNYLHEFGPYFSDAYTTPWGWALNLDESGSDEVRRLICDSALMWLDEYRFDGLRLDAVHAFLDRSAEHLLEQITREVKSLEARTGRPLTVIAESDLNDPRVVTPREANGLGCDAQWSDDLHHALHAIVTGEREGYYADFGSVADLAKALSNAYVYDGLRSSHRGRRHGKRPTGLTTDRFLAYIQNHDQVGNRAQGDRISASISEAARRVCAAVVLLVPFVPMLFQGEEWAASTPFQYFTDHRDPELGEAIRKGRRGEFAAFGWDPGDIPDPQARETFEASRLAWNEKDDGAHARMLEWTKQLIALRREAGPVCGAALDATRVECDEDARWIAFRAGRLAVACAFGGKGAKGTTTIPLAALLAEGERPGPFALASDDSVRLEGDDITIRGVGCAALRINDAQHRPRGSRR